MHAFARSNVDSVRHPLLVLDADLRVVVANPSYCRTFGNTSTATEGHCLFEIDAGWWDQPRLQTLLEDLIPRAGILTYSEIASDSPPLGRRVMVLNAHRAVRNEDGRPMVLLAVEDDTERRRAGDQLRRSNIELEHRVETLEQKGRELAQSVESTRQQTPREEEDLIQGYESGANSYVRKPVAFDQFAEAANQLQLYRLALSEAPQGYDRHAATTPHRHRGRQCV